MMETIFSNPVTGILPLVIAVVYIVAILALTFLYALKKSALAGQILGMLFGLMFFGNLVYQAWSLAGGASFDLYVLSNIITSVAFLFAGAALIFRSARTSLSIAFIILMGPGVILMSWASDLPGIGAGNLHILSVVFALLWLSLVAMILYGTALRRKKVQNA